VPCSRCPTAPKTCFLSFPTQNKMNRNHIQIQIRIGVERAIQFEGS
jgi:hypothetical protein